MIASSTSHIYFFIYPYWWTTSTYNLAHVYTKAIRPWLLRIMEFSLVESVTGPHFRFTWGWFWIATHNNLAGWIAYIVSHKCWQVWMVLVGNVGNFLGRALEAEQDGILWWEYEVTVRACALQRTMGYSPWISLCPSSRMWGSMVI